MKNSKEFAAIRSTANNQLSNLVTNPFAAMNILNKVCRGTIKVDGIDVSAVKAVAKEIGGIFDFRTLGTIFPKGVGLIKIGASAPSGIHDRINARGNGRRIVRIVGNDFVASVVKCSAAAVLDSASSLLVARAKATERNEKRANQEARTAAKRARWIKRETDKLNSLHDQGILSAQAWRAALARLTA